MGGFREQVKPGSSLKGVVLLAAAFTFLLSVLIWSLPGERYIAKRSVPLERNFESDQSETRVRKSIQDRCVVPEPAAGDITRLRLEKRDNKSNSHHLYEGIYGQGSVSCLVETSCHADTVLAVKCETNGCSRFVVKHNHSDLPLYDVSPRSLESIVGFQSLYEADIKLRCDEGKPGNFPVDNWQELDIRRCRKPRCEDVDRVESHPRRVHVISVRFMSRWELLTRMSRLAELVVPNNLKGMQALDFPKYQSLVWRDVDNLALLLTGHIVSNASNQTLVDSAIEKGYDVRVFDLSEDDQHSRHLKNMIQDKTVGCLDAHESKETIFDKTPPCSCSLYQDKASYTEEKLALLTKCLSHVDAKDGNSSVLTITFLENNRDVSREQTVDMAVSNIIQNIISADSEATVLLLSDVGDPSFSSQYNSLFLQTQLSNPFFFMFYPSDSQGKDKHPTLAENRDKLISLRDIHVTISDLLSGDVGIDSGSKYEEAVDQYTGLSLLRSIIPSRHAGHLGVHSPHLGICESEGVTYPNDTLQVAFAEAALGLVNNYIQRKAKSGTDMMSDNASKCRAVVGKRFVNIRKSYRGSTSLTIMDLETQIVATNTVKLLSGIIVKSQSSSDGNHSVSLDSMTGNIESVLDKQILPLACMDRLDVNVSLIPPEQVPLTFSEAKSFGSAPTVKALHSECLFLVMHGFKDSIAYYVMNVCEDREYSFTFGGRLVNVWSVMPLPVRLYLHPGQLYYVTSYVRASYFVSSYFFDYETYYEMKVI